MNTFGRMFRLTILGESHGECVGIVLDGCPAGIEITTEEFMPDLDRRRAGARGTTPRKESDIPIIKSGVFNGRTTGAPLAILFENNDVDSTAYDQLKDTPRPGHADFVAYQKFGGFNDYRGGGHFSGRLTAALVAAGVIAKKIIRPISIEGVLVEAGGSRDIAANVEHAMADGDSVGGVVQCQATGIPAGLGEPFFDSVEALLSHAVFSIPAVKGIEFGSGFASAKLRGSECNDNVLNVKGTTETNHSGGINGGITNGNPLVFRIAVKPTSSIKKRKKTVDLKSGEQVDISVSGRHDACIALRVPPVLEAVTACVLLDLMMLEHRIQRIVK